MFVAADGSLSQIVRLNVLDDRDREDLIGFHFSRQYSQYHYGNDDEPPQFYIVSRDDPWDIEYVLHDSTTFNVEICRLADTNLLKALKIENDCTLLLQKSVLQGYEIQKIEKHFPGTLPSELASRSRAKSDKKKSFRIRGARSSPSLFRRPPMEPNIDLLAAVRLAIQKKVDKNHAGKEETFLILDNLTTHSNPDDFFDVIEELSDFIEEVPFPSIWLYTGYYSNLDGSECEYSLLPLKTTEEEWKIILAQQKN